MFFCVNSYDTQTIQTRWVHFIKISPCLLLIDCCYIISFLLCVSLITVILNKLYIFTFLCLLFRWFKFTLKPPYRIANGNFFSAIWDTSHWNFLVKFGLKTAWDMSYDILLSLLKFVNFWQLQGRLSILAKIGCLQKIKVFSMKERRGFDATWGF